jgi:hypothetical protein
MSSFLTFLSNWIVFLLIPLFGLLRAVCWQEYMNLYYPIYLLAFGYLGYLGYHLSQGVRYEPSFLLANLVLHLGPLLLLLQSGYKPNKTSVPVLIGLLVLYSVYLNRKGLSLDHVYLYDTQITSWAQLEQRV